MKIYEDRVAPNPRRVRMFLAEKGVTDVEFVPVGIADDGILTPEFLGRNPLAQVPVLELDDGTHLCDSVAICRYFESLHPQPALFGEAGLDMARVEMWNRRMEFELLWPIANVFRHIHPFFKGKHPQVPEFGEVSRAHSLKRLDWLDAELADGRSFIAGDRYTIADITALCGIDFGRISGIRIGERPHLARWHAAVSARPSAQA
ncbi:MAG: glutathione S-transferase family protein [Immundisolibacter sp.]|uniref:glutathione S-transferase family protein n=1 Tax=Immundisolibacter sp. TaxID=1934948 RepID=UPI003EE3B5ED